MSADEQTTDEPTDDDRPLFTLQELEGWRQRKAELDTLLGEAGKEAACLTRKIKAAEFLISKKKRHG